MIRHASAFIVVLCLGVASLEAQGTVIMIDSPSAEVHKAPSTGSAIIGTARRGAVLEVTRELGSWVSVRWPGAMDEAFVHVSRGAVGRGTPAARVASPASTRIAGESDARTLAATEIRRVEQRLLRQTAAAVQVYSTPTHVLGFGGGFGGRSFGGFGVSGRGWRRQLGIQLNVSRTEFVSAFAQERLRSVQIEPSVLYALPDRVTDYIWLRPYAGSGLSVRRQTLRTVALPLGGTTTTGVGAQAFGGAEVTFAALPRFAVSADVGRRWVRDEPFGYDLGGTVFSLSGHWYVK